MAHMTCVAAFQIGNPITVFVLVKTNDSSLHSASSNHTGKEYGTLLEIGYAYSSFW
jgi:hypothetical protein